MEAPSKSIVKSKVLLGKFPKNELGKDRARQLVTGPNWIDPLTINSEDTLEAPNGKFSVSFEKVKEDTGDFERYHPKLNEKGRASRPLSNDPVGYATVSPDSKYVALEPLTLIDVKSWKKYDLSRDLGIPNYIAIELWLKNGKSLVLSQIDCGIQCPEDAKFAYWRIDLK